MKVLFIIDSLNSGGAQTQLSILANYLHVQKGCEVEIITYVKGNHHKELTEDSGVKITCFEKKSKFDIGLIIRLIRHIHKQQFNAVCAFLFTPSFYALIVKVVLNRRVKVLVSERTFEGYLNMMARLTRYLYPIADFITANSETQTAILKTKYPKLSSKIFFIKNGVDVQKYTVGKQPYRPLQVASIGRIEKLKNPKCLIETMHLLKERYQINLNVKWAGNLMNNEESKLFLLECNQLLKLYGLEQSWEWLGVVKDIPALLQESEMLIHPSFGEGFPNTICEALATGKVIFASAVYDHPIIIREGYNGFLFDPLNPSELADKIYHYTLLSEVEKVQIQKNARLFAEDEFSYKRMGDSFYNLLS